MISQLCTFMLSSMCTDCVASFSTIIFRNFLFFPWQTISRMAHMFGSLHHKVSCMRFKNVPEITTRNRYKFNYSFWMFDILFFCQNKQTTGSHQVFHSSFFLLLLLQLLANWALISFNNFRSWWWKVNIQFRVTQNVQKKNIF